MSAVSIEQIRDAYVTAFNAGDMAALEGMLHPDAAYRWVAAGRVEQGRAAVMALYRQGWDAFGGASRLVAVPGEPAQAVWHQPTCDGLDPAGLQELTLDEAGLITEIADEHDAERVAAAAQAIQAAQG